MFKSKLKLKKIFIFLLLILSPQFVFAQEEKIDAIADQLQIITQDLKTLEKAVYKTADITNSSLSNSSDGLNEEILTRHLLKLNEIEEEFRKLTNRFEEVNFKLDKLSSRVTKIQSDAQLRFSDLEAGKVTDPTKLQTPNEVQGEQKTTQAKLPGTDKPQDFGSAPAYNMNSDQKVQVTQSVESTASVVAEARRPATSLLPDKTPKEQYDFALSFMKVGDYETAELA